MYRRLWVGHRPSAILYKVLIALRFGVWEHSGRDSQWTLIGVKYKLGLTKWFSE